MTSYDIRILLIDQNNSTTKRLATYLKDSGFNIQTVYDGLQAGNKILEVRPHFILIDMAMPDFSAFDCLDFLNKKDMLDNNAIRVFVMSGHNSKQNVDACLRKGAHDYMVKPVNPMDIVNRMALHLQAKKQLKKVEDIKNVDQRQANYYLNVVDLLLKTTSVKTTPHQINYQLLRMLSLHLKAVRISMIDLEPHAQVIASSDNPGFTQFKLALEKYPEIEYVLRTQKPLFIDSLKDDETLSFIKDHLKSVQFNSMIVLPVIVHGTIRGVLSARMEESIHITDADIRLCQVVAQIFSNLWTTRANEALKAS